MIWYAGNGQQRRLGRLSKPLIRLSPAVPLPARSSARAWGLPSVPHSVTRVSAPASARPAVFLSAAAKERVPARPMAGMRSGATTLPINSACMPREIRFLWLDNGRTADEVFRIRSAIMRFRRIIPRDRFSRNNHGQGERGDRGFLRSCARDRSVTFFPLFRP